MNFTDRQQAVINAYKTLLNTKKAFNYGHVSILVFGDCNDESIAKVRDCVSRLRRYDKWPFDNIQEETDKEKMIIHILSGYEPKSIQNILKAIKNVIHSREELEKLRSMIECFNQLDDKARKRTFQYLKSKFQENKV
jgi:hypothetical protein